MTRTQIREAAAAIDMIEDAEGLRKRLSEGRHELRLYANTEDDTIKNEIAVPDKKLADEILGSIIDVCEKKLSTLKVTR